MAQRHVRVAERFAVPPERLWAELTDHEGMGGWIGVDVEVIHRPPDGADVGTVRRLRLPGLALDEEVTYFDPPRRLVYRLVGGLPGLRFHRGEQVVEPWGQTGSQLTWDIVLDTAVPGLTSTLATVLRRALTIGLGRLRLRLGE